MIEDAQNLESFLQTIYGLQRKTLFFSEMSGYDNSGRITQTHTKNITRLKNNKSTIFTAFI